MQLAYQTRIYPENTDKKVYTDEDGVERKRKVPSKNYIKAKTKLARAHANQSN